MLLSKKYGINVSTGIFLNVTIVKVDRMICECDNRILESIRSVMATFYFIAIIHCSPADRNRQVLSGDSFFPSSPYFEAEAVRVSLLRKLFSRISRLGLLAELTVIRESVQRVYNYAVNTPFFFRS